MGHPIEGRFWAKLFEEKHGRKQLIQLHTDFFLGSGKLLLLTYPDPKVTLRISSNGKE